MFEVSTSFYNTRTFCFTWNVDSYFPSNSFRETFFNSENFSDIYMIRFFYSPLMLSLQNIEQSSKSEESERGLFWNSILVNTFGEKEFIKVCSKQCYGLFISLWVHKRFD